MNSQFLDRLEKLAFKYPKEIDLSLNRISKLLSKLDNPHLKIAPVIHVAGTNGKGSTIAFLFNSLKCAGKKVHVYTSPHLIDVTERFILANNKITYNELSSALNYCEEVNNGEDITQFELLTCIAFLLMSKSKADITLIETGLGGRLDATNVIKNPILSIITSISIDHAEFLGNNLSLIAKEKSGIIKQGVLCISAPQDSKVEKVLINKCKQNKAKIIICNEKSFFTTLKNGFEIHGLENNKYIFSKPSLEGAHQIINAVLAATALIVYPKLRISLDHINNGIKSTYWPGRLEKINTGKIKKYIPISSEVWLDGGHNIAGAEAIKNWILSKKIKDIILICGFLRNKEVKDILIILKDYINYIIFISIDNKNSYTPKELETIANNIGIRCYKKESLKEALSSNLILNHSKVLIFGSLYLVGESIKLNKH
jgi:dihydrofolate synthase/folylpolyglutamate synthase